MEQIISNQSLTYMAIQVCIACMLPVVVAIVWKIKKQVQWFPMIAGMCVYFGIVIMGNMLLDYILLGTNTWFIGILQSSSILSVLYSAGMFALLEGVGRFICFKYVMGDDTKKTTGISYGIGHGALESMFVLGYPLFSYFMITFQINLLGMEGLLENIGDQDATPYLEIIAAIQALDVMDVVFVFAERSLFLIFQIGLAVLVFSAVHYKDNRKYFLISIALQFVTLSGISMITLEGSIGSMLKLAVLAGMVLVISVIARFQFITMREE